ncbi:hypothetical protein Tco_1378183 [Tanacetum coccineum]
MAESSSQKTSSSEIIPKEEPITLDKHKSPNPFLPASQVDFTFDEITFTTNNEIALLYPSHPNQDYFKAISDFISKCCLKEAFTRPPNQYKEYLSEVWYTAKTLDDSKVWISSPTGGIRGDIGIGERLGQKELSKRVAFLLGSNPSVLVDKTKSTRDRLKTAHTDSGANKESRADDISLEVKMEDLSDILKDTRFAFFTPDSPPDEPIIVSDESEEEEESQKEELKQAKAKVEAKVASMKAKPSYPDINHLTELLVTSLKPDLSKLLASHDFANCLPTELKELSSKITGLSGEIKELKKHVRDMEIELSGDLKEIPTKLETFTSTISSLSSQVAELKNIYWELLAEFLNLPSQVSSVQEKLKILDSLPSLLHKVTDTLNRFATMVKNTSGATSMNVASPIEGEKNTKDADTNLKDELVDLLGKNVMTILHQEVTL